MLLEFSLRNFRSFRDEQTLTLVAEANKEYEDSHTILIPGSKGERALRSVAIYGPNASGKTNLLLGLRAMSSIVVNSASRLQQGDKIKPISPFRLDEETRRSPTMFEATFVVDNVEYQYGFEATNDIIVEEWLYSIPKGRQRRWFERKYHAGHPDELFDPGDYFKGQKKQIWKATRPNALYLSTAVQLNNDDLKPIFGWFSDFVRYIAGSNLESLYTTKICETDENKKHVLKMMDAADVGIKDIFVEEKSVDISGEFPEAIVSWIDESGQREEVEEILSRSVRFQHTEDGNKDALLDLDEESHGTQQFFALAGPLLDVLRNGYVLAVDELDSSLHPDIIREVIALFNDPEANPNGAQLIFNLHDTTAFDQEVLRRDQIWITEKFSDGASQLTPLLEYAPRRREALEKNYREGRYGGRPVPRIVQKAKSLQT